MGDVNAEVKGINEEIIRAGLAKAHGTRTLFRGVTFVLGDGRRVALVGANGVGKIDHLQRNMPMTARNSASKSASSDRVRVSS